MNILKKKITIGTIIATLIYGIGVLADIKTLVVNNTEHKCNTQNYHIENIQVIENNGIYYKK